MHKRYGAHIYSQVRLPRRLQPELRLRRAAAATASSIRGFGWVASDYLGIDQGPIIAMIENYRSDLIWTVMQRNPYIRRGLQRAGFEGGWLE